MATPYYKAAPNGAPIIVQGHSVDATNLTYASPFGRNSSKQQQQQQQPRGSNRPQAQGGCRDAFWAILFYAHLGAMAYLAAAYAPQVIAMAGDSNSGGGRLLDQQSSNATEFNIDSSALLTVTGIAGVSGCVLSTLALGKRSLLL
jgi:hypothetical protein